MKLRRASFVVAVFCAVSYSAVSCSADDDASAPEPSVAASPVDEADAALAAEVDEARAELADAELRWRSADVESYRLTSTIGGPDRLPAIVGLIGPDGTVETNVLTDPDDADAHEELLAWAPETVEDAFDAAETAIDAYVSAPTDDSCGYNLVLSFDQELGYPVTWGVDSGCDDAAFLYVTLEGRG